MGKKTAYMYCKCGKKIKRKLDEKNPQCRICNKIEYHSKYIVKDNCLNCGKEFEYSINRRTQKYCSVSCSTIHKLTGVKKTVAQREKTSQSLTLHHGSFKGVKFYEIFCPYLDKIVKVQGRYELNYAIFLNKNGIKWEKSRHINFKYQIDDIKRTYFPDFHLIDSDEFIEIKGHFPEKDQQKMKAVIEQNTTTKFVI